MKKNTKQFIKGFVPAFIGGLVISKIITNKK